jgi:uncharacterized membrane protein
MRLGTEKFAALVLLIFMAGVSAWGYVSIPDGPVPVHFNLEGVPDRYGPREQVLLMMPGMAILMSCLLLWWVPHAMQRSENFQKSELAYGMTAVGSLMLLAAVHVAVMLSALNGTVDHLSIVFFASGALFILIGNYLPKTRPNPVIGIRVPWTLNDEKVWYKTHRLAGLLFMLGGIATVVTALFAEPISQIAMLVGSAIIPAVLAIVYAGILAGKASR